MSKITPTVYEIRVALESVLFASLKTAFDAKEVVIVQPGEEIKPDLKKIYVVHNVNPGKVQVGELNLREGLSVRPGVYTILLSCPNNVDSFRRTMQLTSVVAAAFSGKSLSAGDGKEVFVDLVDIENPGQTPDKRLGQTLSVNWWAWAGGYEGD